MGSRTSVSIALGVAGLYCGLPISSVLAVSGSDTESTDQVEEIVVTAQKRSENLQAVPISVTAFTANTIKELGLSAPTDLAIATPGLSFGQEANDVSPYIRGIGETQAVPGAEGAVALYVDGVYQTDLDSGIFGFNNVDRIEVLKGPQGTLFGRNTAGGLINIITKDPTTTPSADFDVGYANYNTVDSNFYGTTGVTDNLSANLALHYHDQMDGWGHNIHTGNDAYKNRDIAARSKWLLEISDDTKLTVAGDFSRADDSMGSDVHGFPPGGVATTPLGNPPYPGFYNIDSYVDPDSHQTQWSLSAKLEHDFGWAIFKSLTAYQDFSSYLLFSQTDTLLNVLTADINEDANSYSQEFQLVSPRDATIQWVAGLFYYDAHSKYDPLTFTGGAFEPGGGYEIVEADEDTTSYAAYGQATAPIATDTNITVGLRYTLDRQHSQVVTTDAFGIEPQNSGTQVKKFPKMTWRIALDHRFADNVMAYISYNRGFKSGGFNFIAPNEPAYRPEVLDAYEIGVKTEWLNKRLRLNASAFDYEFSQVQVEYNVTGATIFTNAASATVHGAEAQLDAVLLNNLTLTGGLSYLDATYDSYKGCPGEAQALGGGSIATVIDCTGHTLPHSPKFQIDVGVEYLIDSGRGDQFKANLHYSFNGKYFVDPENRLFDTSTHLLSSSVTWTSPNGIWDVTAWARNMLNQRYYLYALAYPTGDVYVPAAPATFGVKLGVHFGS